MKLLWSILFGVANGMLLAYVAIGSAASFRVGPVQGLGHLASATPFLAMTVYAIKRGPRWLWMVTLGLNGLLLVTAFAIGAMASFKPDSEFGGFGPMAAFIGMIPLANIVYLVWRQPLREVAVDAPRAH